jgi:tRNA (guanine37-N1)-methyltransferase
MVVKPKIRFDILTAFPEAFDSYFNASILGRASKKKLIEVAVHDLRRWATDRHKSIDDRPYGGGAGMVLKVEPIYRAVSALRRSDRRARVILFSAKGKLMTQADVRRWVKYKRLIMICGHYEGVDERVARHIADEEISIGEYVLTGGELAAMLVTDAVSRLVPGVLGKRSSLAEESFSKPGYREYPHYTRPEVFKTWRVPKVLLSGDHKRIEAWRRRHARRSS